MLCQYLSLHYHLIAQGQLMRLEERLTNEVELRQSAELSYKEMEAELRQLTATNQMVSGLVLCSLHSARCTRSTCTYVYAHTTNLLSFYLILPTVTGGSHPAVQTDDGRARAVFPEQLHATGADADVRKSQGGGFEGIGTEHQVLFSPGGSRSLQEKDAGESRRNIEEKCTTGGKVT